MAESPRPAAPPACFPASLPATLQRPQRAGACTGHRPLLWPAPPASGVGLSFQGARQADGILSTGSTWPRHLVGLVLANSVLRHWSLAFAQLSCPQLVEGLEVALFSGSALTGRVPAVSSRLPGSQMLDGVGSPAASAPATLGLLSLLRVFRPVWGLWLGRDPGASPGGRPCPWWWPGPPTASPPPLLIPAPVQPPLPRVASGTSAPRSAVTVALHQPPFFPVTCLRSSLKSCAPSPPPPVRSKPRGPCPRCPGSAICGGSSSEGPGSAG